MMLVFIAGLVPLWASVLVSTHIEARLNDEWPWTWLDADERQQVVDAVRRAVGDDLNTVAGYRARDVGLRLVETILALGLLVRASIHAVVYVLANTDGSPDVDVGLTHNPIRSSRPWWNDLSARICTACPALWYAANTSGLSWGGFGPIADTLLVAFVVANGAVMLADPLVFVASQARKLSIAYA